MSTLDGQSELTAPSIGDRVGESKLNEVGILELGCGEQPDPRSDTRSDVRELDHVDVLHDLNETPWPFADGSADGIIMHHVLEHLDDPVAVIHEIARVLKPGGWAELTVPIGTAQQQDPTHKQFWNYRTPEYFARNGAAPGSYDFPTPPLELVDRSYPSLWWTLPGLSKASPVLRAVANRQSGVWVNDTPWVSGELEIRYKRVRENP